MNKKQVENFLKEVFQSQKENKISRTTTVALLEKHNLKNELETNFGISMFLNILFDLEPRWIKRQRITSTISQIKTGQLEPIALHPLLQLAKPKNVINRNAELYKNFELSKNSLDEIELMLIENPELKRTVIPTLFKCPKTPKSFINNHFGNAITTLGSRKVIDLYLRNNHTAESDAILLYDTVRSGLIKTRNKPSLCQYTYNSMIQLNRNWSPMAKLELATIGSQFQCQRQQELTPWIPVMEFDKIFFSENTIINNMLNKLIKKTRESLHMDEMDEYDELEDQIFEAMTCPIFIKSMKVESFFTEFIISLLRVPPQCTTVSARILLYLEKKVNRSYYPKLTRLFCDEIEQMIESNRNTSLITTACGLRQGQGQYALTYSLLVRQNNPAFLRGIFFNRDIPSALKSEIAKELLTQKNINIHVLNCGIWQLISKNIKSEDYLKICQEYFKTSQGRSFLISKMMPHERYATLSLCTVKDVNVFNKLEMLFSFSPEITEKIRDAKEKFIEECNNKNRSKSGR